jgi:hypothetical protein
MSMLGQLVDALPAIFSVCVLVSLILGAIAIHFILKPDVPRHQPGPRGFDVLPPNDPPSGGGESGI